MNLTTIRPFGLATGALALTVLAACSSNIKDDPKPPTTGMSWTVDGAAVSTTNLQSQKSSTTVSVAGTITNGSAVTYMGLEVPNVVGTHTFGPSSAAAATYSTNTGSTAAVYFAGASGGGTVTGAGTIVVTALTTNTITGSFTFTGINPNTGASKSITSGTFNVGL